MRMIAALIFIAGLAVGEPAFAQNSPPTKSPSAMPNTTGQRQPRQSDVRPSPVTDETPKGSVTNPTRPDPNDPDERMNRALNNICRGC
jgi:hypothetical protein